MPNFKPSPQMLAALPATPSSTTPEPVLPARHAALPGYQPVQMPTATEQRVKGLAVKGVLATARMFEKITGQRFTHHTVDLEAYLAIPSSAIGEYETRLAEKFILQIIIIFFVEVAIRRILIAQRKILEKVFNCLSLLRRRPSIKQIISGLPLIEQIKIIKICTIISRIHWIKNQITNLIPYQTHFPALHNAKFYNEVFCLIVDVALFGLPYAIVPFVNVITLERTTDYLISKISKAKHYLPTFLAKSPPPTHPLAPCIHDSENRQLYVTNAYPSTSSEMPPALDIDLFAGEFSLMALFETSFQEASEAQQEEVHMGLQNVLNYFSTDSRVARTAKIFVQHITYALHCRQDNDLTRRHLQNLAIVGRHCYARYLAECRSMYQEICVEQPLDFQQLIEEILADYRERLVQAMSREFGHGNVHIHNNIVQTLSNYDITSAQSAYLEFLGGTRSAYEAAFLRDYTPAHLIQEILKTINQKEKSEKGRILSNYLQPDILWKDIFEEQTGYPGYTRGEVCPHYADWLMENVYNPEHDPDAQDALQYGTYTPTAANLILQHSEILVSKETLSASFQIVLLSLLEIVKTIHLNAKMWLNRGPHALHRVV